MTIIVVIKWQTEMSTLERSSFLFACSSGIGGHFYCNKRHVNKPEPRKLTKPQKVKKYLSCQNEVSQNSKNWEIKQNMNAQSKRFQITWPMRKGVRVEKSSMRVQPEATANTKYLFFLDVGRMPAASGVSIQFHIVSYCSTIKSVILLSLKTSILAICFVNNNRHVNLYVVINVLK